VRNTDAAVGAYDRLRDVYRPSPSHADSTGIASGIGISSGLLATLTFSPTITDSLVTIRRLQTRAERIGRLGLIHLPTVVTHIVAGTVLINERQAR